MNQFRLVTMIAKTTPETHNPRISAETMTHRLREIGERPPYTMYVLYAAFLFWPSILFLITVPSLLITTTTTNNNNNNNNDYNNINNNNYNKYNKKNSY